MRSVTNDSIYGFVVVGPVKRNHTFFFGSMDFQDFRQTVGSATRPAITQAGADLLKANASKFAPGGVDYILKTYPIANDPTSNGSIAVRDVFAPGACTSAHALSTGRLRTLPREAGRFFCPAPRPAERGRRRAEFRFLNKEPELFKILDGETPFDAQG